MAKKYVRQSGDRVVRGYCRFNEQGELESKPARLLTLDGREIPLEEVTTAERLANEKQRKRDKRHGYSKNKAAE